MSGNLCEKHYDITLSNAIVFIHWILTNEVDKGTLNAVESELYLTFGGLAFCLALTKGWSSKCQL